MKEIIRRSDTHNFWLISCEELNISCTLTLEKLICLPFCFWNDFSFGMFDFIRYFNQEVLFVWFWLLINGKNFQQGMVETQTFNCNIFQINLYFFQIFVYTNILNITYIYAHFLKFQFVRWCGNTNIWIDTSRCMVSLQCCIEPGYDCLGRTNFITVKTFKTRYMLYSIHTLREAWVCIEKVHVMQCSIHSFIH